MSSLFSDTEVPTPRFQYLQIELTNRCNLSCRTCLHAAPGIRLHEDDLSTSTLTSLIPALQHTTSVHLQGWGESMLTNDFPERIRWFKKRNCKVSFTTRGSLMTRELASQLVASGLDSITFSMTGASTSLQDSLRGVGTHEKLIQSMMQLLHREKRL